MSWSRGKTRFLIGMLVSSLLLGRTSVVWAAPPAPGIQRQPHRHALLGKVTAVDGTELTLNTPRGEATVLIDGETRFRVPEVDQASVADVHVGDRVAVQGRPEGAGVLRARLVFVIPKDAVLLHGKVEEVVDQALTLIVGEDEVTAFTDEKTRLFIPGIPEPSLKDLQSGDQVVVAGTEDEGGNVIVRAIRALLGRRRALVYGQVMTVNADGFLLSTRRGELAIQVDRDTRFRAPAVEEPGLDDLSAGTRVLVGGIRNAQGGLLAKLVGIMPERPQRGRVIGQVANVEGTSLTLTLRSDKEIDLLTDENTRFVIPGVAEPTLTDLEVGDTVGVQGPKPEEGEIPYAAVVVLLRDAQGQWNALRGELTAVEGATLTVQLGSGDEIQLMTDEATQFFIEGSEERTLDDLQVGEIIGAHVMEREDGTLYASAIGTDRARRGPRWGAVRGEISAIDGEAITLVTRRGEIIVLTDEHTRFIQPGIKDPGVDNLEVGQMIGAAGRWTVDGDLQARIVGTPPGRKQLPQDNSPLP